jgi:glucosylceramidase
MILDKQGGPNWFKNWCVAPIIVDPEKDEVYFTPIYYVMAHFSKFIRPDAVRIDLQTENQEIQPVALKNPNGDLVVVIFNPTDKIQKGKIAVGTKNIFYQISKNALQTIILKK